MTIRSLVNDIDRVLLKTEINDFIYFFMFALSSFNLIEIFSLVFVHIYTIKAPTQAFFYKILLYIIRTNNFAS